ncbi:MAG: TetR/AcrR family transcriptional regulator [Oscillospiraceae bacterium]|nr:TetR/AcrR family transcriptional regulator [Oscillospiraceae bacterium]
MKDPTVLKVLGQKYPKTEITSNSGTKERILLASASLFAKNGYFGVSVKDISNVVGIKPASLYNHYESKEALWKSVLERIQELYLIFLNRLEAMQPHTTTIVDIIDNLFYELKEATLMFTFYGVALIQSEQFHSGMAADLFHGMLLDYSIGIIKKQFDICVESGNSEPFDTQTVASMIMHSFLVLNNVRVHEDMGYDVAGKASESLDSIRDLVLNMISGDKWKEQRNEAKL